MKLMLGASFMLGGGEEEDDEVEEDETEEEDEEEDLFVFNDTGIQRYSDSTILQREFSASVASSSPHTSLIQFTELT